MKDGPILKIFFSRILVFVCLVSLGITQPQKAFAMSSDVNTVLVAGAYGAAAGTVVGLATYPFNRQFKGIFVGTSVGLYVGIIVGIFLASSSDSPERVPRADSFRASSLFEVPIASSSPVYIEADVLKF